MKFYIKLIIYLELLILFNGLSFAQNIMQNSKFADFQISSKKYVTNESGNILMNINIWGHVRSPGNIYVNDGIDFATLISLAGGPMDGANLKKIRLYREIPDEDGALFYEINFKEFLQTGDRSNFIEIKPNDTLIIPRKTSHYILEQIGTLNTIFAAILVYLNIQNLTQ